VAIQPIHLQLQSTFDMFFYFNIRVFKIKLNNYINFAVTSLNSLKFKQIKIYYNLFNFKFLYYRYIILFFIYMCINIYLILILLFSNNTHLLFFISKILLYNKLWLISYKLLNQSKSIFNICSFKNHFF